MDHELIQFNPINNETTNAVALVHNKTTNQYKVQEITVWC